MNIQWLVVKILLIAGPAIIKTTRPVAGGVNVITLELDWRNLDYMRCGGEGVLVLRNLGILLDMQS